MSDSKSKKEAPKSKQVAPEGNELVAVSGSVMKMEVPTDDPAKVQADDPKKPAAAPAKVQADDPKKSVAESDVAPGSDWQKKAEDNAAAAAEQRLILNGYDARAGLGRVMGDEEKAEQAVKQAEAFAAYEAEQARLDEREERRTEALEDIAMHLECIATQLTIANGHRMKDEIQNKTPKEQREALKRYSSFGCEHEE